MLRSKKMLFYIRRRFLSVSIFLRQKLWLIDELGVTDLARSLGWEYTVAIT